MSSRNQPHDVIGTNTWLKRWPEYREGEDGMIVNQGLDLDGIMENGENLGGAIPPQTHFLFL
jgi:hypothetical protein